MESIKIALRLRHCQLFVCRIFLHHGSNVNLSFFTFFQGKEIDGKEVFGLNLEAPGRELTSSHVTASHSRLSLPARDVSSIHSRNLPRASVVKEEQKSVQVGFCGSHIACLFLI